MTRLRNLIVVGFKRRASYRGIPVVFRSMMFSVIGRMGCGILGIALFAATSTLAIAQVDGAFHYNRLLGRGINLGNALDGPQEGAWGVTLEADYFRMIKEAGFNSVRI